jgi:DNA-binding beta-propeller fold protein YncE
LYVADVGNNKIRKITPQAMYLHSRAPGAVGSADGAYIIATFNAPTGITIDKLGNVFVADRNNHTIRMITPAGTVSTIAGLAGASGLVNSQGSFARFNQPTGLAVDKTGGFLLPITATTAYATWAGWHGG